MNRDKIAQAMERIEELYYETNGQCYFSFSGGKDSTVILALIKMCEEIYTLPKNAIPAVFCNTGIELGATVDFVNWCKENYYGNIQIIRPEKPFSWVLENKGKPMKSKLKSEYLDRFQKGSKSAEDMLINTANKQYSKITLADTDMHMMHPDFGIKVSNECCHILKKKPFEKYAKENDVKGYIVGERMSEGGARELNAIKRLKSGGKLCTKTKGDFIVKLPIIDWTDDDVEDFLVWYNIPLSDAYMKQGYERTGCFLCPFSKDVDMMLKRLWMYEPNKYKAALFWLKDVYIAQNVRLPFDEEYEEERLAKWKKDYQIMRYESMKKYKPSKAKRYTARLPKEYLAQIQNE